MFKTVLTLFRGGIAVAGEELEDRTALVILDQQMRDAAAAVDRSKRTLALAIAQDQQEGRRLEATCARIADLELRATAALDGGREDLAREAAQQIAGLEADRDAAMTASTLFAQEIARLKRHVVVLSHDPVDVFVLSVPVMLADPASETALALVRRLLASTPEPA